MNLDYLRDFYDKNKEKFLESEDSIESFDDLVDYIEGTVSSNFEYDFHINVDVNKLFKNLTEENKGVITMQLSDFIMDYLKDNFNFDYSNSFVRNTLSNFVDYAVENFNNSKSQLAYYLSDMIDEVDFDEMKAVISDYEKYETYENYKNILSELDK